jgi:CubicO group peptidase (beta-lactamase class C family)
MALVAVPACTGHRTQTPSTSGGRRPSVSISRLDAGSLGRQIESYLDANYNLGIRRRRAVVVSVAGAPVVERYYGRVTARTTCDVRSVTKTVVATLIGMALAEGRLHSLDQTLFELLPAYRAKMSTALKAVTLRQLLTMTSGLQPDNVSGQQPLLRGPDWVGNVVRHAPAPNVTGRFAYSSAGSHLLSAILVQATGQSVLSYARSRLFDPLAIATRPAFEPVINNNGDVPEPVAGREFDAAGFAWLRDPTGMHLGFAGLKLTARDMTKLGTLYLNQGMWRGRQLLPRSWVQDATRSHVSTGMGQLTGYGYQLWVTAAGVHPAFAAVGYGGQLIEVVPDLRLVVAVCTTVSEQSPANVGVYVSLVQDVVVPVLERQLRSSAGAP